MIYPSGDDLQVILGPIADAVADEIKLALARGPVPLGTQSDITQALGGSDNLVSVLARGSRLCIDVRDGARIDWSALSRTDVRQAVSTGPHTLQLITGPGAERWVAALTGRASS